MDLDQTDSPPWAGARAEIASPEAPGHGGE